MCTELEKYSSCKRSVLQYSVHIATCLGTCMQNFVGLAYPQELWGGSDKFQT